MTFLRAVCLSAVCLVLAACSPITNSGIDMGIQSGSELKQREDKIKVARERARKARAQRQVAFKKAREDRALARKDRREARKTNASSPSKKVKSSTKSTKSGKTKVAKKTVRKPRKRRVLRSFSKRKPPAAVHSRVAKNKAKKRKNTKVVAIRVPKVPKGKSYGISVNKPWRCVPNGLKNVLRTVAKRYGRVVINSTHRSWAHNRRVGGKKGSYHLTCRAVDFNVYGNTKGLSSFLRNHPSVGGFKRYKSGYFHIDNGPRRTW
ncbi:MAG: D-Ala-D-Ala carboxypeptidase family metallohydrolase [Pseudomonadota bacterium]